jgi:hypothetical protein
MCLLRFLTGFALFFVLLFLIISCSMLQAR